MNKENKIITIAIIAILVVGAGSFYGGMKFGQFNKRGNFPNGNFQGQIPGQKTGNANGGNSMISGSILSKDENTMTLQLPNNKGTKIILYSSSTQVSKSTDGSINDIKTGDNIIINGKTNTDGSVTAQSIQIKPAQTQQ